MKEKIILTATENELEGLRGLRDYCADKIGCEGCTFEAICRIALNCSLFNFAGVILEKIETESEEEE